MTGEKLAWFRVASHLHIPVEELAARITYRELAGWVDFLEWEQEWDQKSQTKLDYYLAQIAFEICRSVAKEPRKLKVTDFLLKFVDQKQARKQDSKATWLGIFGLGKGNPPQPHQKRGRK